MRLVLDLNSVADYRTFLRVKSLPVYRFVGREAWFPDEYAAAVGAAATRPAAMDYAPRPWLFDYQRDIASLAIRKRKYAVFADCVAAGTMVETEHGPRPIETLREPCWVWCRDGSGRRALAWASPSWVNGYAPIYEYVCASGRRVRATAGHRFMTGLGWRRGDELRIGERLLVSDACRPPSSSEPGRSALLAGGPSSGRTVRGSTGGCSDCCRRGGERLRSAQGVAQSWPPSQAGVHAHTLPHWRVGVRAGKSVCTRRCPPAARPSMPRSDARVGTTAAVGGCQLLSSGRACTVGNTRTSPLALAGTTHGPRVPGLPPSAAPQTAGVPCDFSFDTLVAVHYIRDDVFYDIEVPGHSNYIADGFVSHNCGLGKTAVELEYARHALAALPAGRCVLIVCPLMVVDQTIAEARRFYGGEVPLEPVAARDLPGWLAAGAGRIGITNYEAITDRVTAGRLGALVLDESSMLKSHYGKWGQRLIRLGRGLDWKLCLTGTPAPNDRIEYANHAVLLDQFPTVNSFLSRFFVNRGETGERWELKPHALRPFYRALSHWSIFLTRPAVYGWRDNAAPLPPIHTHILDVPLTRSQMAAAQVASGTLFGYVGGIGSRHKMARIAKGIGGVRSRKPGFVADLAAGAGGPCIVWCRYNAEQAALAKLLPGAANVAGDTPVADRRRLVAEFQAGERQVLLTKPKILGFGLNLQAARRQVFSTCQDSYEEYYQAVKRSNRYGSDAPLDVFLPVTDLERPMVETVLAKARRVQADTEEQERLFREVGYVAV